MLPLSWPCTRSAQLQKETLQMHFAWQSGYVAHGKILLEMLELAPAVWFESKGVGCTPH